MAATATRTLKNSSTASTSSPSGRTRTSSTPPLARSTPRHPLRRAGRRPRVCRGLRRVRGDGVTPRPASASSRCSASPTRSSPARTSSSTRRSRTPASRSRLTASEEIPPMVDQMRFFAGAARVLEGRRAGEYMAAYLVHPARADRRGRPGDALELPDDDGDLEDRARRSRQATPRAQAERHDAGLDAADGRDRRRVLPARRVQRDLRRPGHRPRAGRRTRRRRWSSITGSVRAGHGGRQRGGRRSQAGPPRARRQGAGHRLRRRRHRGRGRDDRRRRLLQRRPGLHGGDPRDRLAEGLRRLRRRAGRAGQGGTKTGSPTTRTSSSGRSTTRTSSSASPAWSTRPRPRHVATGGHRIGGPRVLLRADGDRPTCGRTTR